MLQLRLLIPSILCGAFGRLPCGYTPESVGLRLMSLSLQGRFKGTFCTEVNERSHIVIWVQVLQMLNPKSPTAHYLPEGVAKLLEEAVVSSEPTRPLKNTNRNAKCCSIAAFVSSMGGPLPKKLAKAIQLLSTARPPGWSPDEILVLTRCLDKFGVFRGKRHTSDFDALYAFPLRPLMDEHCVR
jgi:hypothetical protein